MWYLGHGPKMRGGEALLVEFQCDGRIAKTVATRQRQRQRRKDGGGEGRDDEAIDDAATSPGCIPNYVGLLTWNRWRSW